MFSYDSIKDLMNINEAGFSCRFSANANEIHVTV